MRPVRARERRVSRGELIAGEESDRRLLMAPSNHRIVKTAHGTGDQAVIARGKCRPRASPLFEDVLQIGRCVEFLIVVDPKIAFRLLEQDAANSRRRVDRVRVRHNDERAEAVMSTRFRRALNRQSANDPM